MELISNRFIVRFYWAIVLCFACACVNAQSRIPIAVSNTATPATTLTNYTVRVDINATNAPGFDFTNNGDDLIAWNADTTAQLDFYVENVDAASQTAIVWVRVPSVPPSPPDTQIFLDYNRSDIASPLSNLGNTFTNSGFQYHSQPHTVAAPGPESRVAGEAEFNFNEVTSNPNYGCTNLTEINDDHSGVFTQNGDFGLAITTQFIVPADALYEFRFGNDFGSGGELYLDDVALEADWSGDLWWGLSFANADVLQGSRFLTAGSHTLRALGYERCCDGRAELQYRYDSDGDGSLADETFSLLTTASPGITLFAPSCPTASSTVGPIITVPVTLAKLSSFKAGPFIRVNWETADETFNAGFNIWTLTENEHGEEELQRLNRSLIRSHAFDSTDTQSYHWRVSLKRHEGLDNLVLSSVDISGKQEFFGPFEIGETYGESFTPQPINWASVHAEFESAMHKRGYQKVANRWRKHRAQKNQGAALSMQVGVDTTGVHRVTYEELLAQGLNLTGVRKREIAVTQDGNPVPRAIVKTRRGKFGPGSAIDFVGQAPNDALSIYTAKNWYQIKREPNLVKRIRRLNRDVNSAKSWHHKKLTLNKDTQHLIFSPLESPWVMDLMFRTSEPAVANYEFDALNVLEDQVSRLNLTIGGIANAPRQDFNGDGALDNHHEIEVLVNGDLVHQVEFSEQQAKSIDIELAAGIVKTGLNTVSIKALTNGYSFDVIAVDTVTLEYPTDNVFGSSMRFADVQNEYDGIQFSADRRKGLIAYAYDDHNLIRLRPKRAQTRDKFQIPLVAVGKASYFLGRGEALLSPVAYHLLEPQADIQLSDTDMLIVSHPAFIGEELESYTQSRRLQGVHSQIVSTEEIQRQYGADQPLHIAIKRFLKAANEQIQYKYVLIVGGHTFDYVGRQNSESINFIPTFYTSIGSSRFTPTDQPFVDFDGDGFPEKSIGRWPVREVSQIATIAHKSVIWAEQESTREQTGHGVLLLGDKTREFNFAGDLDTHFSLINRLAIDNVDRVYIDAIEKQSDNLNQRVQDLVFDGFANGASWVFYNGHGSPNAWSFSQMLAASRVKDLANEEQPVLITSLGCYTTYYESPTNNSLALQLLFAGNNAAVAIHGPSVVGSYEKQLRLANYIAEEAQSGKSIGTVIQSGMRSLPISYRTAVSNWALLGDPSLPIQ